MDTRPVYVYCVCDPRHHTVVYVGQTVIDPVNHIKGYSSQARLLADRSWRTAFNAELMSLLRELEHPMVVTLEVTTRNARFIRERLWIEYFRSCGETLLNRA